MARSLRRMQTRVLVTHGPRYLPHVDAIVVMEGGRVVDIGPYPQLMRSQGPFANFLRGYAERLAQQRVVVSQDGKYTCG